MKSQNQAALKNASHLLISRQQYKQASRTKQHYFRKQSLKVYFLCQILETITQYQKKKKEEEY
jgi:hypothetical protein